MNEFIWGIAHNHVFKVCFLAWLIAQVLKVFFDILSYGKLNLRRLMGSGGMPSSHTALVLALATSTGKDAGWDSIDFAITAVIAAVVMYDAAGVRRAAGQQAEVLNQIINDIYRGTQISQERLKELIGHTPFEVLIGALLGIVIALAF
mgnify:CR=1 FL=1